MTDRKAFEVAVFELVSLIPRGRATTYGAIARAAGFPNHSRLAGKLMHQSSRHQVAAHRVVGSGGRLVGRHAFATPGQMQQMLEAEGVKVSDNRIVDWKTVFWDPLIEIGDG